MINVDYDFIYNIEMIIDEKTEKQILFAETLPDINCCDEVHQYFESEFIYDGNLSEIIDVIEMASALGCLDNLDDTRKRY